jgi:hypothetical protein
MRPLRFLLAGGTDTEKLKAMRHRLKLGAHRNPLFEFANDALTDFHNLCATSADQMMPMDIISLAHQGKPRCAVA